MKFRLLKANEIDCRISTINERGLSLLLYKDARVDQNILDETVGAMNWQRSHSRDNANCTVSIWDDDKRMWVSKEDTGTESFSESAKGLASDSFKRACFNWGIGRELYTAPRIWISSKDCNIQAGSNGKPACYDHFTVSEIEYDEERCISRLVIKDGSRIVFDFGAGAAEEVLDEKYIASLKKELLRTGVSERSMLNSYGVDEIEDLSLDEYKDAMNILKEKPAKAACEEEQRWRRKSRQRILKNSRLHYRRLSI